jgi:hypothetical protein
VADPAAVPASSWANRELDRMAREAQRPITTLMGGAMTTGLPRRVHLDTIEYRIYTDDESDIDSLAAQDAVADAVNVALEQLKRDLAKHGLAVEADF